MRVSPLFPILLLLAGCSSAAPMASSGASTEALFLKHGVADRIEIRALNRLPLRAAALIAPSGAQTGAEDIIVSPTTSLGEGKILGSAPFSGGSFGVTAIPASPAALGGAPQGSGELLLMQSTGSITLPDPIAYRRDWRGYRIRLRFGNPPGAVERRVIAAPRPPGG